MMQLCNEFKDAIVALVVKRWSDRKPDGLGRTMLQKLVYFIQAKGVPVPFEYRLHYYGPFSQSLSESIEWLKVAGAIVDRATDESRSDFGPGANIEKVLEPHLGELHVHEAKVDQVIEAFANLGGERMELLSTTHFVQNAAMVENTKSRTIREVRRVKGDKFSEEEIEEAIKYLKEHGF
jgi:uncharacterized protein YwgA